MKIESISILNLKSYPRARLKLSPGINLLVGENNSGKSTIIRTLLNLQYRAFEKKDIRCQERSAKTSITLSDVTEADLSLFKDPRKNESIDHYKRLDIYWHLGIAPAGNVVEENLFAPAGTISVNYPNKSNRKDVSRAERKLKTFPLFPDMENRSNFIFPFLAKRKTEFLESNISHDQSFKIHEAMRNLAARIHRLENPSHPMHESFVSLCIETLGFKIGVIPIDQQNVNGYEPGIYVTNTSMIPMKSMGEGVVNILGFIVTLLTEDNKLILVEELENDIHPKALKKLLSAIRNKSSNSQFVISTHSHIVLKHLGAVPGSQIFFTESINNFDSDPIPTTRVTSVPNDAQTRVKLLEKLGYDFSDLELFESYLILEESSAECIIRDFLIPNFVPNLYGRIRTIASRGIDDLEPRVVDFNRLFVFVHTNPIYFQKAWVIADGDKPGLDCIARLRKSFRSWPTQHFMNFTKSNFEEYYPRRFEERVRSAFALHGEEKKKVKEQLTIDVMNWALKNREDAIKEFKESASEVIALLVSINKALQKGDSRKYRKKSRK